jgi:hypothetical protein
MSLGQMPHSDARGSMMLIAVPSHLALSLDVSRI